MSENNRHTGGIYEDRNIKKIRIKSFSTSVGEFKYYYLHPKKYSIGITLHSPAKHNSFLIATPEKALCDQIYLIDRNYSLHNLKEMENYLIHYLRIDESLLLKFKLKTLKEITNLYKHAPLLLLYEYIKNRK